MSDHYILVGQTPVPVECDPYTPEGMARLVEWGRAFEDPPSRIVKQETVLGLVWVSTVFLGLDHRFIGDGPPILFETMAFWAGLGGEEQERCATWLEAEEMHRQMVAHVSRPGAVWSFLCRSFRDYWRRAWEDAEKGWREVNGWGPKRTGDPLWDSAAECMEQLEKIEERKDDDEWAKFA